MEPYEVPEKIYFGTQAVNPFYGLTRKCADDDIEYVHLDAFINKACEWLENHNNYQRVLDNGRGIRFDMTQCVIDFRKAMKGE